MKLTQKLLVLTGLLTLVINTNAQIAGSFTVPIDFPNMAAAINTLNVMGVAGPVTINVNAGYTETVSVGGLKLFNASGTSSTNTITFKKNGSGANPLLVAYSGGVGTPTSAVQDGVWWLVGADYITIDGIDILDPNTSSPATMEFGYGLYNASTSDGCQHNIFKNCVVTLNRSNGTAGSGLIAGGSRAIEAVCASYTQNATTYTPSSSAGTNSYNKFYSNLLQNCHNGIALMGYQSGTTSTLSDQQNDIGGTSAATSNTVINFGGGVGSITSAIRTKAQFSLNVSFNTIQNNNGSGGDPASDLYAINIGAVTGASMNINSNTITLSSVTSTSSVYGIYSTSLSYSLNINILNNIFASCSFSNSSGHIFIVENSNSSVSNISNNLFSNISSSGSGGLQMVNTDLGALRTISSNTISNVTAVATGAWGFIVNKDVNLTLSNNLIENVSAVSIWGIYHTPGTGTFVSTATISSNVIRNMVTETFLGISSTAASRVVSGNSIYSISSAPGNTFGLNFEGIELSFGSGTVTGNSVYSVTSSAATTSYTTVWTIGLKLANCTNLKVSQNKIASFSSDNKGPMYGIYLNACTDHIVFNNIIGDLNNTGSTLSNGLCGIYSTGYIGANSSYYYNTVYLNSASSSTASFGSSAVLLPASGSTVTLKNNILINTSAATGTGVTTVLLNPNGNLNNYGSTSNNNLLYTGTGSPNWLYYDGTNTYSTMASFKAFSSPRESQSYLENPPFLSTVGTQTNYLNLNPAIPTLAESDATPISGYTTDYAGTVRNASTPDIGAWEGNFLQADVLTPTIVSSGFTTPACDLAGRSMTVNFTDASGVASGSLSPRLFYRLNFGLYTSVQGSLTSGTYSNGVWTFNMTYSGNAADIVRYFFTVQDISPLNNLALIPSTGGSVTNVNTVPTPPTTTFTYSIGSPPTVSANSGSICPGENFTVNPSGAVSYSISGGSFTVSPSSTTSYSIIGTNSLGCVSSNTAIALITVIASPTVIVSSGSICTGQNFSISPSGADSYTISGGSMLVSPTTNTSYTITGSTSTLSCLSLPVIVNVTVYTTPTVSANSGSICAGNVFTINPSGAASYVISGGSATVSPLTSASYTITGTSTAGCVSANTATANITVAALPTISVNSGSLCSGQNFTINPSGAAGYTYSSGSAVVSPLTNTFYTITGTSSAGCLSANTATINIMVSASPTISVNSGSICSGQNFSIIPIDPLLNYSYPGGSALVSPATSTLYSIVGTNSLGCLSNTAIASVAVFASPTVAVNSGTICIGNSFTINPIGAAGYAISGGSFIVSPATNSFYLVTGTSSAGCISVNTATANVTVASLPTISAPGGSVCSGQSFTITASGASSYIYSGGTAVVSPLTNTFYTVSGTSSLGCQSSNTVTVNITVLSSPSISVNSGSICSGQSFSITPSNSSLNYTYSGGSALVSPATTTFYTVSGTNSFGCVSNIATANVTVAPSPTVSVNSGSICLGSPFTFTPAGATTYSITGGSFTVSPATSAIYTVTGQSSQGCISMNTATATLAVYTLPTVGVNSGSICAGQVFTLQGTGAATYSYPAGSNTVSPANTTTYAISGSSSAGCASSNTAIATVFVNGLPTLSISGPTITCANASISLTVNGASTYTWMNGSHSVSITVSPASNSNYTVSGTDLNGCTNTSQFSITVNSLPQLSILGNTTVCAGSPAVLNVSGTAITFTWSNGTTGNIASYTTPQSTVISISGTDVNGCVGTATQVIFVNSLPIVFANANNNPICSGDAATLYGSGASSYTWSGGISNNTAFYPSSTSSYTVTGADANNCRNTATIQLVVNALPVISIVSSEADTICEGQEVDLTASGANLYSWSGGQLTSSISVTPGIGNNSYTVTGTDANGCHSEAHFSQGVTLCTGLQNQAQQTGLRIFPNPNKGAFTIEVTGADRLNVELHNLLGEEIYAAEISGTQEIKLNELCKGIYMLRIFSGSKLMKLAKVVVTE